MLSCMTSNIRLLLQVIGGNLTAGNKRGRRRKSLMPPGKQRVSKRKKSRLQTAYDVYNKYVNFEFLQYLVFDPSALPFISILIVSAEFVLNLFIIWRVPYTEIDWKAYMQECEGFINGTTNYALLKGDTGPLVYPAAFVYIYTAFYYLTSHGQNVRLGQYIFAGIYFLQMSLSLRLYIKSRKVPPYVLVISAFTSYRIHSIYVLRLFNDPVAILFLYAALNAFMDQRWTLGSVLYSIGVGVKMNVLLFAPALLLFYIANLGYWKTLKQLIICATVQLLLGLPFLLTFPLEYIKGSFDIGRIFEHKWTVNYRFLSKALFEHKFFHISLLLIHITLLIVFARPCYAFFKNYVRLRELQKQFQPQILRHNEELKQHNSNKSKKKLTKSPPLQEEEDLTAEQQQFLKLFEKGLQKSTGAKAPIQRDETKPKDEANNRVSIHFDQCTQLALLPFFICNLIGVMCARSLHYQFYVWYYHSLPYLTWSTTYSLGVRYLLLGLIELCWNTYPSTNFSSGMLHFSHIVLLIGLGHGMYRKTQQSARAVEKSEATTSRNGTLADPNVISKKNS